MAVPVILVFNTIPTNWITIARFVLTAQKPRAFPQTYPSPTDNQFLPFLPFPILLPTSSHLRGEPCHPLTDPLVQNACINV